MFGCAKDDVPTPIVTPDAQGFTYLRLEVRTSDAAKTTRTNPTGGENGDGLEPGTDKEDEFEDLMVFIIDDADAKGANANSGLPFKKQFFFEGRDAFTMDGISQYVMQVKDYDFKPTDRILVAVNIGDCTDKFNNLGELRTFLCKESFRQEGLPSSAHRFVMATAYNPEIKPSEGLIKLERTSPGSISEPNFTATATVERLAARLDIMAQKDQLDMAAGVINYDVASQHVGEGALARIRLGNVLPVNVMQHPSYLLKHVTRGLSAQSLTLTQLNVCGHELMDINDIPTNYVVEPRTTLKESTVTEEMLQSWYGETRADLRLKASESDWAGASLNTLITNAKSISAASNDGNDRTVILGYADENTLRESRNNSRLLTGLMLRCQYIPAKLYTNKLLTDSIMQDVKTAPAKTFWRFKPTGRAFTEDDCRYFSNAQAANDYRDEHPELLGDVECFTDGYCYYSVYLRHAFDADADPHHKPFPMEYAIVRNNIYRIGFKFKGPGDPLPTIEEPETVDLRIFVRKWNLRQHSLILM